MYLLGMRPLDEALVLVHKLPDFAFPASLRHPRLRRGTHWQLKNPIAAVSYAVGFLDLPQRMPLLAFPASLRHPRLDETCLLRQVVRLQPVSATVADSLWLAPIAWWQLVLVFTFPTSLRHPRSDKELHASGSWACLAPLYLAPSATIAFSSSWTSLSSGVGL